MPSCRLIKCLVSVFLHTSLVPSCTLFTAVLPKRLYKTPTPYIHYHLQDKTHRSHHGLIKRARQTPSLLTLSPFPLFLHWRSPLPFCLLFLFPSSSISWATLAVSILFCNLDFIGCHVFDIRSGHIYFQGQYSAWVFSALFPFCLQCFLSFILCFGCISFQSFPCYSFSAAAPEISVLQGSLKADTHEGFCSRSSLNLPREHAPKY